MMSGQPFIPLYFEEEDLDLWKVLAAIQPENRARAIKAALRQVLVSTPFPQEDAHINISSVKAESEDDYGNGKREYLEENFNHISLLSECSETDNLEDEGFLTSMVDTGEAFEQEIEFSLEELFVSSYLTSTASQLTVNSANSSIDIDPKISTVNLAPWENLLYNIIGTEDDDEVLAALNKVNGAQ